MTYEAGNNLKVSLLTGGGDPNYAIPLTCSLIENGVFVDFIGSDTMKDDPLFADSTRVRYWNLRGNQDRRAPLIKKIIRVWRYYCRLVKYCLATDSRIIHVLWLNKITYFDRTLMNVFYKALGKTVVFTAHNVNAGKRDGNDSILNRCTLKFLYHIVDKVIVHTNRMKSQLVDEFKICESKILVMPFGINQFIPCTELSAMEAKKSLGILPDSRTILFFGRIVPYKGLEYLIPAFATAKKQDGEMMLIIAGMIERGCDSYWERIQQLIKTAGVSDSILYRLEFIADKDIEIFFKASDLLVLPYKHIFQSGPLFTAFRFGLPVVATDVGSIREDVEVGQNGFICKQQDSSDMAEKIGGYFESDLYRNLSQRRERIITHANTRYSWEKNGRLLKSVYRSLLECRSTGR